MTVYQSQIESKIKVTGRLKLIQYILHLNKQKITLGLQKTQQFHEVKRFDENAAQKVILTL